MRQSTLRLFSIGLISLSLLPIRAQESQKTVTEKEKEKATAAIPENKPVPVFCGVAVTADLVGLIMKAAGANYSQIEASARINFKEKYFPVVEVGYGSSDYHAEESNKISRTKAPYMRIGMDYNFTKKRNGNRLYAGIRYGFTAFHYDLEDPDLKDPVWGGDKPFHLNNEPGRAHWGEAVFGLETRIWKLFHMGWTLRYKFRFNQSCSEKGEPWYIPGFGKNGSGGFGGTFNVIFDI